MDVRPTTIERAYQLACAGMCSTVRDIKVQLRKEGYEDNHIIGRTLLIDLRRLCSQARRDS